MMKVGRAAVMVGWLMSSPATAQDEQLVDLTDIVPSGRAGVYSHGTYPSECDTPLDRNRPDFLAAVEKARVERAAEDQRSEAARLAAQPPANGGNDSQRSAGNDPVVKFRASCPGLSITRVFESKFQGLVPGYAMHVTNN